MNDMAALLEPLIPPLRRYARALLRDRDAADDLVQDCLERTISRWHLRRPDGDARSWVFTILHNLAVNRLRRGARRGAQLNIDTVNEATLARAPTQEDGLRHRELLHALGALPDEQRAVLLLVGVEDLSYAEAAQVLDVPIGTVMSRLARARDRLLKVMDPKMSDASTGAPNLRRIK
ncbi:RNA polymerase sigma-70 factor, ECF subfamily [Rhizobiales bacterium GAS191]|nr:RNA polymerase sigma-70 factor, ECF subfamily [Rhizobiales bacterium GAS191]